MVLWQHKATAAAAGMSASSPETAERRNKCIVCVRISGNLCGMIVSVALSFGRTLKCVVCLGGGCPDGLRDAVYLHEQAARCRHGPLLPPAWTLEWITKGALPQHGFHQDLKQ